MGQRVIKIYESKGKPKRKKKINFYRPETELEAHAQLLLSLELTCTVRPGA